MAPHSSTLAWEIPWTEELGRLQSMGLLRVRRDWATSFSLFTFMHWRRKWQPTPVLLPGKSHGRRSLVGCSPWGRYKSDTTEQLHFTFTLSTPNSDYHVPGLRWAVQTHVPDTSTLGWLFACVFVTSNVGWWKSLLRVKALNQNA